MGCIFRARLNSLWSIWYTVLAVLLQGYLLYLGFERYRLYTDMKWPHGAYPQVWLTIYISLYGMCIPLCLLFVAFGVFKSGNLGGDNEKLAARTVRVLELTGSSRTSCCLRFLKSLWLHAPPLPQMIHVKLALFQLFAQQIMLAQLYRFGFINSGDFLNTELDFLYQRARQLVTNLPMDDTPLQGFRITTEELVASPLAPNLLPILMHVRLFGIPLEFVNLLVALLACTCAYPAVFWRVHKTFSLLFSVHLLLHLVEVVITYLEFCILFRVQETSHHSIRPIGLGQHLSKARVRFCFHPVWIIATYLASTILMHAAPIIVYSYGYQKYFIALKTLQNRNRERAQNAVSDDYGELRGHIKQDPTSELCCGGFWPHALAILFLFVMAVVKMPAIYGMILLYDHEQKAILLHALAVDVLYLSHWIAIWFLFTCKASWNFSVLHQVYEFLNIQSAHHLGFGTIVGKAPSELKNALIMMQGDHMYVTDDPLAKQSLMRHALKTNTHEEVYCLRPNQSPTGRKLVYEEGKATPETGRLYATTVRRQSSGSGVPVGSQSPSVLTYPHQHPHHPHMQLSYQDEAMGNQFGTLQRGTTYAAASRPLNFQTATLGRPSAASAHTPESYASITKSAKPGDVVHLDGHPLHRRGSQNRSDGMESVTYGNNAMYATYGRTAGLRNYGNMTPVGTNNSNYRTFNGGPRQASEPLHGPSGDTPISSVAASPLLMDKKLPNMRDPSPYQRTGNLSSFNNNSNPPRPTINAGARLPPAGNNMPQQWNTTYKQPTVSASSSQQDSSLTPTSINRQGSLGNFSTKQTTPTAGSPIASNSNRFNGFSQMQYARTDMESRGASEPHQTDHYASHGLTKSTASMNSAPKTNTGPIRMPIKSTTVSITRHHDDSANFSMSSSNESEGKKRAVLDINSEYATSVV